MRHDFCCTGPSTTGGRWGESSWLNYWQGRDEGLWAAGGGDTGQEGPRTNSVSSTNHWRVLGGK